MSTKYLDENGLLYFWGKIKSYVSSYVSSNSVNSSGVTDVKYDTTSKKIQQSKDNGSYADVVALAAVATSGSYNDLSNKPTIPSAYTLPTATDSTKGGVTLSDATNGTETAASGGKAATPKAVADALAAALAADTTYSDFTGATSSAGGAHGLVPAPVAAEDDSVLWGDGDWEELAIDTQAYASSVDVELQHGAGTTYDSASIPAATSSLAGVMTATDKAKLDALSDGGCWYGTSSTAATTANKVVTCPGFSLKTGAIIAVMFSMPNTAGQPSLNVNDTGTKGILIGNSSPSNTYNVLKWDGSTLVFFMYDSAASNNNGAYHYLGAVASANHPSPRGANTWYGSCSTSATTAAKTADIINFVLTKGAIVVLQMTTENTKTDAALTLNVNSTGAYTIYVGNAATSSSNNLRWSAGSVHEFVYDGTYWRWIGEKLQAGHGLSMTQSNGAPMVEPNLVSINPLETAASSSTDVANRTYPVALDDNKNLAVNVPWTDTTTFSASAITSGTFDAARIPNLAASKITSGTFDIARIPITGSVADGNTGLVTGDAVYDAIQNAIGSVAGISFDSSYTSVSDLPATGTAGVIYLIPNSGSNPNSYDEYVWVGSSYEKLGTTDVDLTGYLNTTNHIAITNAEIDTICV